MLENPTKTKDDIVAYIRDYFDRNLPNASAVIGISGGKDSSVAAALCKEALGSDRVVGVLMPDGVQPDIDDSRALVETLGIKNITINISEVTSGFDRIFAESEAFSNLTGKSGLTGEAKINNAPRVRMSVLYAIAQSIEGGALVINTCNRSEDYVGYSTKYGDAAGDLSPLGGLLVHEVLQIGEVLGLPEYLVKKTPSDGLSGKSDEDKLGFTYETLDRYILTGICEDEATRERIDRLHVRNLHKLETIPTFRL